MPSFQTKPLMVPPISGDNFGIIPRYCMVGFGKHVPTKRNFLFCKEKLLFDALLNACQVDAWSARCTRDHSPLHGIE